MMGPMSKKITKGALSLFLFVSLACWAGHARAQEAPDRIILFIIDGVAVGAPDRFEMPHYNALKKDCLLYTSDAADE